MSAPAFGESRIHSRDLFGNRFHTLDTPLRLRAFAKINLGLSILGRRPDHYHEIRTVLQTVRLHDRLEVSLKERDRSIEVLCDAPDIPAGPGNLVYRAAELWRRERGLRAGIEIRLKKNIPAGSGLGGASSDAAATLLGLEKITGNKLPASRRLRLAAQLGSDVPFFLWGGRALAAGRGEEVYPLADLPVRRCLIVFPNRGVSTKVAYRWASLKLTGLRKPPNINRFGKLPPSSLEKWSSVENDFESVVLEKWPELARLKRRLLKAGGDPVSLSGSGSAVYAIFKTRRDLEKALCSVPRGWTAFRTATLRRTSYQKAQVG